MIGLPEETDDDIEAIAKLVTKCKDIFDRHQSWSRIILTIAPFVPKAGTPFQREGMASLDTLKHRLSLLKSKLPSKGISVKNESLEKSSLAWWHQAMQKAVLDIEFYAHVKWDAKQKLPWSLIE